MSELQNVTNHEPCRTCRWSLKPNDSTFICDYLERNGHSRTIKNGKRRILKGFCDKYEERE